MPAPQSKPAPQAKPMRRSKPVQQAKPMRRAAMVCVAIMLVSSGACRWRGVNPLMVRRKTSPVVKQPPAPQPARQPLSGDAVQQAADPDGHPASTPADAHAALPADAKSATPPDSQPATSAAAQAPAPQPTVVGLSFDVIRVELPVSSAAITRRIWKYVDESNADPSLPALLARNGVRIGVAEGQSWPALRAMFTQAGGRTARDQLPMQNNQPGMIHMGPLEEGGMYFLHRRGGRVEGGTFEKGERFIRLDYEVPPEDPQTTRVRVMFETRGGQPHRRFVDQGGRIQEVTERGGRSFGELACTVTLNEGQFLVLGSADNADKGFRIGSWWFRSRSGKERSETLVCVRAEPFRVE